MATSLSTHLIRQQLNSCKQARLSSFPRFFECEQYRPVVWVLRCQDQDVSDLARSKNTAAIAGLPEPKRQAQGCCHSSGAWRKLRPGSFQFGKPSASFIRVHIEGDWSARRRNGLGQTS